MAKEPRREVVTNSEKEWMSYQLNKHRKVCRTRLAKERLRAIPFHRSSVLFGVETFACTAFGRQLVLKIVDELLDIGVAEPKEGEKEDG